LKEHRLSLSPTVLFIPTPMEESLLPHPFRDWLAQQGIAIRICGLGPIHAGIEASRMLAQNRMSQAILMGIAGAYDDSLAIGQASFFDRVACYGIGLGTGAAYQTPVEAGWDFGSDSDYHPLSCFVSEAWHGSTKLLLTCCASSYDAMDVRLRQAKYPEASAEDMEAYAIAVACRSTNTPFSVVRGISNHAGDRDLSHWKIQEAMRAASDLLYQFLTLDPPHD
jgi:futalosine hydrolase